MINLFCKMPSQAIADCAIYLQYKFSHQHTLIKCIIPFFQNRTSGAAAAFQSCNILTFTVYTDRTQLKDYPSKCNQIKFIVFDVKYLILYCGVPTRPINVLENTKKLDH